MTEDAVASVEEEKAALGELLFNDTNLSENRTMSCATCHSPDQVFVDPRSVTDQNDFGAVSIGDDNLSLGDRNAPTASYAMFFPEFYFDEDEGLWMGGQFHDGRAADLQEQAKGPFLNPVEMRMENEAAVIERILENSYYVETFKNIYGADVFDDTEEAYEALAEAIGIFEMSDTFRPFDSKFDRVMNGDANFTAEEQLGFELFVREDKGNCAACHTATGSDDVPALFTDATYDNLGVPVNEAVRMNPHNPLSEEEGYRDLGLGVTTGDTTLDGAFKVATLRNIAVTAPYMHNGIFKELKTVVHFYNTRDVPGAINPETGNEWRAPEVPETINTDELGDLGLTDEEEDAIVAFMKTLTDQRYEYLFQ